MNKIALVDIDDTLADTQLKILEYVNQYSEQKYLFDGITREFREGGVEEYENLVRNFLKQPELIYQVNIYPSALESIQKLYENYRVHIASSRREPLHKTTEQWLKNHGLLDYVEKIHSRFSNQKGGDFKVAAAKTAGASIAFDDTLDVAEALAKSGVTTYLIDKPWNQSPKLPSNIIRVENFEAAVDQVVDIGNLDR